MSTFKGQLKTSSGDILYPQTSIDKVTGFPTTSAGDLIYGGTGGELTTLAAGTDGQILKSSNGAPQWGANIPEKTQGIFYAQVDSTSTSTNFTVTIPELTATEYYDGLTLLLYNGKVTSASGFTINVNGLGAKPSYSNMALGNPVTPTDPTRDTTIFNINYAMLFTYNSTRVSGGCWICYRGYDANTNTIGYQVRTNNSTLKASDKFYRYRLLFTSADGTQWVPANTSTSTNATAARNVNQRPIDPFGEITWYGTTTAIEANANVTAAQLWQQYYGTYTLIGYSFNNTGAAATMTANRPIYIKCTPQSNGSAIIDANTPYVQALPSTDDGKIYIFLGRAVSATAFEILLNHPVYYHKDGAIRVWTNPQSGGMANPMTALGDMIYGDAGADPIKLSIGTSGQVLTSDGSIPYWATPATPATLGTLNTTATTAQTTSASESFSGNITLHKVSKTGTYSDLIGKPTIPSAPGTLNTTATTAQSTSSSEALSGNITLHKIAKTGTYADLIDAPAYNASTGNLSSTTFTGSGAGLTNIPLSGIQGGDELLLTKTLHVYHDTSNDSYSFTDSLTEEEILDILEAAFDGEINLNIELSDVDVVELLKYYYTFNLFFQGVLLFETSPVSGIDQTTWTNNALQSYFAIAFVGGGTPPFQFIAIEGTNLATIAQQFMQMLADKEDLSNKVTSISSSSTNDEYPSAKAVNDAITNAINSLPTPMQFKGTVGSSGTIEWSALPTAAASNTGYVYKVISDHATAPICKNGDTIVSNGSSWVVIPSGDEPSGTVTSVAVSNGGGISVSGSPITSSGTITISHADTSSQASVDNSGRTYIQDITLDTYGHVTGLTSATETVTDTTYEFTGGTNGFTVTPYVGGTAQTAIPVTVTPSITNNITGSGTATHLAKFSGANAIEDAEPTIDSNGLHTSKAIFMQDVQSSVSTTVSKLYFGSSPSNYYSYLSSNTSGAFTLASANGNFTFYANTGTYNCLMTNCGSDLGRNDTDGSKAWNNLYTKGGIKVKKSGTSGFWSLTYPQKDGTIATLADNTDTTYTLSGALSSHKFTSTLTAGGSGSGTSTSDFTLAAGSNITLTDDTSNRKITIAATDTNTTYSLTVSGTGDNANKLGLTAGGSGSGTTWVTIPYATTSGSANSVSWSNVSGHTAGVKADIGMTTLGDIIHGDAGGNPMRLGIGTAGQVLISDGYVPTWGSVSTSGISSGSATSGYVLTADGSGGVSWAAGGGSGTVTSVDGSGSGGISVTGGPITSSGTLSVGVDSSHKLLTTTEWGTVVTATQNNNVSVAGTTKTTYTYGKTTIFAPNGLIMGGTAASAGLVTRGVCGVTTPNTTTGAATKDNLFLNYDGDNTYRNSRQIVIQAGAVGTHYGSNVYQYCAVRGDALKGWIEGKFPNTTTANKVMLSTTTNGTAKWSDWSTAGVLKTNTSGVVSVGGITSSDIDSTGASGTEVLTAAGDGTTYWSAVPSDIYLATYGTTSFALIGLAILAGKLCVVEYQGDAYIISNATTSAYTFSSVGTTSVKTVSVNSSNVWSNQSAPIGGSDIFWCTYGTTTYYDILNAYNAGKVCIMKYNDLVYTLSYCPIGGGAMFSCVSGNTKYYADVDETGTWSNSSQLIGTVKKVNNTSPDANGNVSIPALPAVTSADAGKILMVDSNGNWVAATMAQWQLGGSY